MKLSDWLFNAINAQEVLTLHRDYFRLKKPIERRVYELARKHCGQQNRWSCSVTILHEKSGSRSTLKEFRRAIRHLVQHDHLPDYGVELDEQADKVIFTNRGSVLPNIPAEVGAILSPLKPDTYEHAKRFAPGWDVYYIEQEWREWLTEPPRNPDAAFLGFCNERTASDQSRMGKGFQ